MKKEYIKSAAFINREGELGYLTSYLMEESESILFIYGPKSSGKTTLLYKLIDRISKEDRYDVKSLNLREIMIRSYKDFIKIFFNVVDEGDKKRKNTLEISAGIFKINHETEKKLLEIQADPFKVMKRELIRLNERGKQPVIIIDELQELQEIYVNGQRQLINELFNFFIAITKESHLAHIIISSSDGYFIETVYEESRMRKTSGFYKIDYLTRKDVFEWLSNLKKYSKIKDLLLTEKQIEEIWNFLGGSCWEIQYLLSQILKSDFKTSIARYKKEKKSEVINALVFNEDREKILLLFVDKLVMAGKEIVNKSGFEETKVRSLLQKLVSENILFFDPVEAIFKPQSRSIEYGIKMYFKG